MTSEPTADFPCPSGMLVGLCCHKVLPGLLYTLILTKPDSVNLLHKREHVCTSTFCTDRVDTYIPDSLGHVRRYSPCSPTQELKFKSITLKNV